MKNFKKKKGITLIALIITIIILLILAGVALSLIAGSNGIIEKAEKATDVHNKSDAKEQLEMIVVEARMEYFEDYAKNSNTSFVDFFGQYVEENNIKSITDYETENGVGRGTFTSSNRTTILFQLEEDGTITELNGIVLTPTSVKLLPEKTETLEVTLLDMTGTVTFESSNTSVATVSNDGIVTAVNTGKATITAKIEGTSYSATCEVTVVQALTSISMEDIELEEGTTQKLKITKTPDSEETEDIKFELENTTKVKVDSKGNVIGVAPTETPVKVTAIGVKSGVRGSCQVTVTKKSVPKGINISIDDVGVNGFTINITPIGYGEGSETIFDYYINDLKVASSSDLNYVADNIDWSQTQIVYVEDVNGNRSDKLEIKGSSGTNLAIQSEDDPRLLSSGWDQLTGYSEHFAFDKDYSTSAAPNAFSPSTAEGWTVGYDFGEPVKVARAYGALRTGVFEIQYSDDNVRWLPACGFTVGSANESSVPVSFDVDVSGQHRYWRAYLVRNDAPWNWAALITELEFDYIKYDIKYIQ